MASKEKKEHEPKTRYPFFRIVGPVGAGKSTLAMPLAQDVGVYLLDEPFAQNPYLEDFYTKNPADYSFNSQIFFLALDALDTKKLAGVLPNQAALADAGAEDNRIIARVHWKMGWMTNGEYDTYMKAYRKIYKDPSMPKPDMYYAVKAKTKTVVRRIQERARPMELLMLERFPKYFPMVVREFNAWLRNAKRTHLVREIDSDKYDIVSNEVARNYVLGEARSWARYCISSEHQLNFKGKDGSNLVLPELLGPRHHTSDIVPSTLAEARRFTR